MPEQSLTLEDLTKLSENLFEIAKTHRYDMRVPARICANKDFLEDILKDKSLEQLINVTTLPGIQDFAIAMPDIHQGYGFPIGGVAAMDLDEGVISPGGIGYDINCGMRLLMTSLRAGDVTEKLAQLADELYAAIPSGVGKGGQHTYTPAELDQILQNGAEYMFKHGLGTAEDLVVCEENGRLTSADSTCVSPEAKKRGMDQLGTLGSGNHFLEVQRVETVFNEHIARNFGLFQDQIVCMIHCGSRGLGHQICTDYVRTMIPKLADWNIILPDRELACAPFKSVEGQQYFKAMACAANFAWANRHVIGHHVREVMHRIFGIHTMVQTLYDVSHNIGKIESHTISGKQKIVLVHGVVA